MRTVWGLIIAASLCAGCASQQTAATPPISVQEARALVLAERTRTWKDPDSIRDAMISAPYQCLGWTACVCVEANAKNSMGGYTGLKKTVANISGRTIVNFRDAGFTDRCDPMEPFPELNGRS
jgi:hypothetical protein